VLTVVDNNSVNLVLYAYINMKRIRKYHLKAVRPEYTSFLSLRGKIIALDNSQAGNWLMFERVLQKQGLNAGDYI